MKHEVKIPKRLRVAGHTYKISINTRTDKGLDSEHYRGVHSDLLRTIEIKSNLSEEETSCTFLHECIHAVDVTYCASHLAEDDIRSLANGLHQILEQLGVRFVK